MILPYYFTEQKFLKICSEYCQGDYYLILINESS